MCLGDNVIEISSEKIEGSGDWNSPEYQDTASSKGKKDMNALSFYKMETDEISEWYIAPCFMNGLEVYDGEINLAFDENLISNEFVVKLCLDYEMKKGKKFVKKELIVALKGELYFVKFIMNPEEDDFEPRFSLGRSFLRLAKGVVDFGNGVTTIYPKPDPFEDDSEKTGKSSDDWDHILDFNFDDVPKFREELLPFVCKMGKSNRNKKRAMENLNLLYQDIGPSSSAGGHLTQEEVAKAALAIKISQKLEEKVNKNALADTRSDINTMPYRIYETLGREEMKNTDRGITMINHTQAEAMGKLSNVLCQVGVTTIIAKFLILDIPIDRDAPIVVGRVFLYTMGSILNTPERLFLTFDGVCHQTFRAARFDVLRTAESDSDDEEEYVIKRNKFGASIYGLKPALYLNCTNPEDRSSAIQTTLGTHDGEARSSRSKCPRQHETVEELLLPQVYHEFLLWEGCNRDAKSRMGCDGEIDDMLRFRVREAESDKEIFTSFAQRLGLYQAVELEEDGFNVYFEGGLRNNDNFNAQDYWLSISQEDNLGLSRSHTSTIRRPILRVIHKMITYGLCQRTTGYDKVQKNDSWLLSMFDARHQSGYANVAWVIAKWMKRKRVVTQKENQICCGQFISKLARKCRVLTEDVVGSLSALVYYRDLDSTTLRDLIDSDGKLILEDPQPGMPRVGIPRPPRASMQDLYDRIGRMEIRQDVIE
ncbi:retrotransposon ORF1 [Tanacetum coccineum]